MSENKEYMTHPEELGCIHISEEVLASLASGAVAEVEGVSGLMNVAPKKSGTRGVRLVVDEEGAVVDVYILIRYGYAIPEVAGKIQNAAPGGSARSATPWHTFRYTGPAHTRGQRCPRAGPVYRKVCQGVALRADPPGGGGHYAPGDV